jgi:hypothetical protein
MTCVRPVSRGCFDMQLSWCGCRPTQPVPGHRISYSLWGLRHQACCLAAPGWIGPHLFGDNPADLLASAEQLLRRICVVGAPSRLFGLGSLVAELVWEANTGAGA